MFDRVLTPQKKVRWPYAVGALIVIPAALALSAKTDTGAFTVVTPVGIKTVREDMTEAEVKGILGKPLGAGKQDGCIRYGQLKLNTEVTLYSVCYAGGKVTHVLNERFDVREVATEATLREAGLLEPGVPAAAKTPTSTVPAPAAAASPLTPSAPQ